MKFACDSKFGLYLRKGMPSTAVLMLCIFCDQVSMKKVNKQCLLDTPRTVRVSEKTWQVIVQTSRP